MWLKVTKILPVNSAFLPTVRYQRDGAEHDKGFYANYAYSMHIFYADVFVVCEHVMRETVSLPVILFSTVCNLSYCIKENEIKW